MLVRATYGNQRCRVHTLINPKADGLQDDYGKEVEGRCGEI